MGQLHFGHMVGFIGVSRHISKSRVVLFALDDLTITNTESNFNAGASTVLESDCKQLEYELAAVVES
jgi:hypothetical protein